MAYLVAKHPAAPSLYPQLAYLLDISNIARNALALPLPGEAPFPAAPPAGSPEALDPFSFDVSSAMSPAAHSSAATTPAAEAGGAAGREAAAAELPPPSSRGAKRSGRDLSPLRPRRLFRATPGDSEEKAAAGLG